MKRSKNPMEVMLWFSAMCRETHLLIFFGMKEITWVMADLSPVKNNFPSRLSQMKRTSVQRTTHWDRLLPELTSLLVSQWYMFNWLYLGISYVTEVLLRDSWISFDTQGWESFVSVYCLGHKCVCDSMVSFSFGCINPWLDCEKCCGERIECDKK